MIPRGVMKAAVQVVVMIGETRDPVKTLMKFNTSSGKQQSKRD